MNTGSLDKLPLRLLNQLQSCPRPSNHAGAGFILANPEHPVLLKFNRRVLPSLLEMWEP
jgi:hypothetical protein